jgi:hypothetical protein
MTRHTHAGAPEVHLRAAGSAVPLRCPRIDRLPVSVPRPGRHLDRDERRRPTGSESRARPPRRSQRFPAERGLIVAAIASRPPGRPMLRRMSGPSLRRDGRRSLTVSGDATYAWRMSQSARARSATLGPAARPVAIPDDIDAPGVKKAQGVVELPLRVRWSGPARVYDLSRRADRARVYELVLAEGAVDDVRRYIELDHLVDLWPDLVLPRHVRRAWSEWLANRRGISLAC